VCGFVIRQEQGQCIVYIEFVHPGKNPLKLDKGAANTKTLPKPPNQPFQNFPRRSVQKVGSQQPQKPSDGQTELLLLLFRQQSPINTLRSIREQHLLKGPKSRINRAQVRKAIESEGVNRVEVMVVRLFAGEQIRLGMSPLGPVNQQGGVQRRPLNELGGETTRHRGREWKSFRGSRDSITFQIVNFFVPTLTTSARSRVLGLKSRDLMAINRLPTCNRRA